jgi:hypothetical protein
MEYFPIFFSVQCYVVPLIYEHYKLASHLDPFFYALYFYYLHEYFKMKPLIQFAFLLKRYEFVIEKKCYCRLVNYFHTKKGFYKFVWAAFIDSDNICEMSQGMLSTSCECNLRVLMMFLLQAVYYIIKICVLLKSLHEILTFGAKFDCEHIVSYGQFSLNRSRQRNWLSLSQTSNELRCFSITWNVYNRQTYYLYKICSFIINKNIIS